MIFVLQEIPHEHYKRDNNNLIYTATITLPQALTGCKISLPTLDGRTLEANIRDVISPGYEKVLPGEGMPVSKNPGTFGDMIIRFNTKFPTQLTEDQKNQVKTLFANCSWR